MLSPEERQRIEDEERKRIAEERYRAEVRAKLQQSESPPKPQAGSAPSPKGSPYLAVALAMMLVLLLLIVIVVLNRRGNLSSDVADSSRTSSPGTNAGGQGTPMPAFEQAASNRALREHQEAVKNLNACPGGTSAQSDGTCPPPVSSPSTPTPPSIQYVPATQQIASGQVVVPARGYVQYKIEIRPAMLDAHVSGTFNASGGRGNDVAAALTTESEYVNWINGHEASVLYATAGKKTTDSFDVELGPGTYIFAISNKYSMVSGKYVFLDVKLNYQRMETN
jgi:hypothetical protein